MISEKDSIKDILLNNMPWSPLDFINDISTNGDRDVFVSLAMRELDESNDLRFVCPTDDGYDVAVFAEKLPWDTEFFGYGVAKLNGIFPISEPFFRPYGDVDLPIASLMSLAKKKAVKYLFASVDARDLSVLRSLGKLGFSLIETRMYYHMNIREYHYPERYSVRPAIMADVPSLGRTAAGTVNLYDRFHADPFIDKADADRLMYRWVEASICNGYADMTIVPNIDEPKAFCTIKYHQDNWDKWKLKLAQVVLIAVAIECKGWHKKLISEINYHMSSTGIERLFIVTQATNIRVIKTWEALGYRFGKAEHICRIIL
jgi:hypothetical protein